MSAEISLKVMTRDMCHAFYRDFKNDPAVFAPGQPFEEYVYDQQRVDAYFDEQNVETRRVFAIMQGNSMVGEIKLKYIDFEKQECSMGIHLLDDTVKGKGYGTQAEKLILKYAFDELNMKAVNADALINNTRSRHVLEKAGFCYVRRDDTFAYYRCEKEKYSHA